MPNHVINELSTSPDLLDCLGNKDEVIDFNTIIPMPEILVTGAQGYSLNAENWAEIVLGLVPWTESLEDPLLAFKEGNYRAAAAPIHRQNCQRQILKGPFISSYSDGDFEGFVNMLRAYRATGYLTSIQWSNEHWGTKWNAYATSRVGPDVIRFETAWASPLPVIVVLCKKFPEETVRFRWASEDVGSHTGDITIKGEEVLEGGAFADNSDDARRIATELWGQSEEET